MIEEKTNKGGGWKSDAKYKWGGVTTPMHHLVVHKANDHLAFTFFQADGSAGKSQLNDHQCTTVVAELC